MSLSDTELEAAARAWLVQDPDPVTRAETETLLAALNAGEAHAKAELTDRFGSRLGFGTAGLRGALGAGPNRMNRVLVGQAAAGFGRYLLERATGTTPTVVIGFDGRVNSDVFASDSAEILSGMGVRALLLPRMLPTPVLAFAVRQLGADAGIMVTASHNPPEDNGYKVYLGGADHGSQIVSPADRDIAGHIAAVAESVRFDEHPRGQVESTGDAVVDAYVAATARELTLGAATPLFVYTAMHGVGADTFLRVLDAAGYPRPILVAEQAEPDGRFPTVAFPNPEEPGALDLAYAAARAHDVPFIVAHDPDADRLAVAIPDGTGTYRRLTGNELGLLLAWHVAEQRSRLASDGAPSGTLACSMVSSPGLREIARAYQLDFQETPTGFKWISRADDLVFGFEEALGYLVNPATVRDKDGISAAAAFLSIASALASAGQTIQDRLDACVEAFGCFASSQVSVRVTDLRQIADTMSRLRAEPPRALGSLTVDRVEDLAHGHGELPPADVLRMWLSDGSRVMVRPSGTEPKLKVYIDAAATAGTVAERRAAAESTVAEIETAMRALVG